jgi:Malic enzyme, NAD binding domain
MSSATRSTFQPSDSRLCETFLYCSCHRGPAMAISKHGAATPAAAAPTYEIALKSGVQTEKIARANALVFPGLGLGVTVAKAPRISDPMIAPKPWPVSPTCPQPGRHYFRRRLTCGQSLQRSHRLAVAAAKEDLPHTTRSSRWARL